MYFFTSSLPRGEMTVHPQAQVSMLAMTLIRCGLRIYLHCNPVLGKGLVDFGHNPPVRSITYPAADERRTRP